MSTRIEIAICLTVAIVFGAVSYRAAITKFPTYDEPIHFAQGFAYRFHGDQRIDPENPPLWELWPMLAIPRDALRVDPADPAWQQAGHAYPQHAWTNEALFNRDPAHGIALINRTRAMMTLVGAALILASAWWAHRIAGAWAAVATSVLLAFDPNLLAHAPLLKNDAPMALVMAIVMIVAWELGKRVTWLNAISLALLCAVAINVKLSAIILPGIVIVCLLARALQRSDWIVLERSVKSRMSRMLVPIGMLALIGVFSVLVTWAAYGFRFAPSSDPSLGFSTSEPSSGPSDHLVDVVRQHHLMPEAFCVGLLRQHFATQHTRNFLLGEVSGHGWWYYFPFAFLVKSPLATLTAILVAAILVIARRRIIFENVDPWALVCLGVPFVIFLAAAMQSDYNHGLRNVIPIFPMLYICVAVVFARSLESLPRASKFIAAALCVMLAAESLCVFPDFLSYFNFAAGGSRGGLRLLGDSNLDWGQDLNQLVAWHKAHPDVRIYLACWEPMEPSVFGFDYTPLPGYYLGVPDAPPNQNEPGVLAISATLLEGIYIRPPWDAMYAEIRTWKPREVLGGTIYLYDFPNPAMTQSRQ